MVDIRPEKADDVAQVRVVNELAFGQPDEAALVDKLRAACDEAVSLVADEDEVVVGHILFTPAVIEASGRRVVGMGLAPMAVLPERQRQGIGSSLVRAGLEVLRERRCPFVIVLGHPEYYPRFGFEPASAHGLACQWEGVPEQAFMVAILDEGATKGATGVVRYRQEFDEAG